MRFISAFFYFIITEKPHIFQNHKKAIFCDSYILILLKNVKVRNE